MIKNTYVLKRISNKQIPTLYHQIMLFPLLRSSGIKNSQNDQNYLNDKVFCILIFI